MKHPVIIWKKGMDKEQDRVLTADEIGPSGSDCTCADMTVYLSDYQLDMEKEKHDDIPEDWVCKKCNRKLGERYTVRNRLIYQERQSPPKITTIRNVEGV